MTSSLLAPSQQHSPVISSSKNRNSSVSSNEHGNLEQEIQTAQQIYQSIKSMRLQKEQQQKKRRLRQRMRSLENEYTWMKNNNTSQQISEKNTSSVSTDSKSDLSDTLHPGSNHSSTSGDETPTFAPRNKKAEQTATLQEDMDESFQSDATVDPAELLEICEEQQDILELLTIQHGQDLQSWTQKKSILQADLEKVRQERHLWKKRAEESLNALESTKAQLMVLEENEEKLKSVQEDNAAKQCEIDELRQQVKELTFLLANKEESFEQRMQKEQTKTKVASEALQTATQRFETLQNLVLGLDAAMKELPSNAQYNVRRVSEVLAVAEGGGK
jgi:hypothetical protein